MAAYKKQLREAAIGVYPRPGQSLGLLERHWPLPREDPVTKQQGDTPPALGETDGTALVAPRWWHRADGTALMARPCSPGEEWLQTYRECSTNAWPE